MEQDNSRAGPSHDPSQHAGIASWHIAGDRSNASVVGAAAGPPGAQDEVFLAAHEAAQAQRDSQGNTFKLAQEKSSKLEEKTIVKASRRSHGTSKENTPTERYSCPAELILLHCPKCLISFEKPPRKRVSSCERCDSALLLQCSKCRKIFRKYMTLYCHVKAICGSRNPELEPKDGRLVCPDCSTRFSNYENLKRHKRLTCNKQAGFKCTTCPFVSKYKASLELHERSQHGGLATASPHSCDWCGKSFRYAQTLRRHETYNCGKEKGFSCGHCEYRSYLKYQLKNHMRAKHQRLFSKGSATRS